MGKRFDCDIVSKSTFSDNNGTKICQEIETSEVKSIVKNEKLVVIQIKKQEPIKREFYDVYQLLLQNNIIVEAFRKEEYQLQFRIKKEEQNKVQELLEKNYPTYEITQKDLVKLSIVGYGIIQDNQVLNQVIQLLKDYQTDILNVNLTQAKIEVLVNEIDDDALVQLHQRLINDR